MPNTLSFEDAAPASTLSFEDAAPRPEPLSFEDATPTDTAPRFQDANGFIYTGNKTDNQSTPGLPTTQMGDARSESPDAAFASAVGGAVPKVAEFARKYANPVTFIPRLGHTVSQLVGTTPKDEPFFADSETPILKVEVNPNATDMGKGMGDFVKGMVEGLSTPKATSEMAAAMAGAPVAKIVSADFLTQMAAQAPEQASAAYDAIKRGDTREAVKNVLNFSLSAGAPLLAVKAVEAGKAKAEGGPQNLESANVPEAATLEAQKQAEPDLTPVKPKGEKPVVPETPPEEERGINVSEEIRQKGARTIADIQRLYPLSNLSREQARVLRDQAWGKPEQPVPVAAEPPPVPTAVTPPVEQPTTVEPKIVEQPAVKPSSARVNPAVKAVFDKLDNDENYTVRDAAEELAQADKLPRDVRAALKQYQKNREADVKEFGQRSGLEEEGADALQSAIEKHVGGESDTVAAPVEASTVDVSPIKNAATESEATAIGGRMLMQAKTAADMARIQSAMKGYKPPVGDQATEVAQVPPTDQRPVSPAPITFAEFEKQYRETYQKMMSYSPDAAGSNIYAEKLAALHDQNPKWAEAIENKPTEKGPYLAGSIDSAADLHYDNVRNAALRKESLAKSKPLDTPAPAVEKPVQQTFVGMGGATPSEFDPIGKSPTAMKYKLIDQERVERGLEPIAKPAKVSDPIAFAKAEAAFDNDPAVGEKLVQEILSGKKHSIDDWQNHVLLLQKIDLRDQYYKSARESAQAFEDVRLDDVAEANIRTAEWADKLNDVEQASRISGSARGRALRSLQVMANEDMTLASLEMQKRASKGGAPLTVDERAQLQKVADDYKAKLDAYEKYQAARETKIKEDALKEAFARVQQENKTPQYHPKVLERAEQLVAKLEVKASAALKDLLGATWSPGPEVLGKMALVGAAKLARGVLEVSKWTDAMVRDLGERFRPYAQQVYDLANKELEKQLGPSAKVVREKGDLNQQRDAIGERIAEKVKDGKKDELAGYIQRLAKVFYKQGVITREGMVDALHGFLEPMTKMSRREVSDAFSGYGDFKQLSKDQITVALRGMKGELQQLAKLEDMAAGKPPLKSGVERRSKTDVERQIEKLVNEAKYKFQIPITDPNTQLKSALDTFKTQMTNRIKDYEQRLANKDFAPRPRRELVLDATALRLKAEAERVKNKFQQAMRAEQLKNRPKWEKTFEQAAGVARMSALSGYHTLAKLFSYTLAKLAEIPLVESTGAALSRVPGLRPIFEKANLESGSAGKSIAALYSGFAIKGMKAAAQVLRTGTTDAKSVYGKVNIDPPRWYDFFGTLHSAEKAPLQTGSMEMYIRRGTENAIKAGLDPRDEFVRAQINKEAYDYSQRDILMENNKFAEAINMLHKRLEQKNPKTGKVDIENALVSTLAKTFLTKGIVRTPANYIAQTIARTPIGLATGVLKAGMAHYRGIGNLHPAEANAVARLLKVGAVGSAFFVLGMIDATKPQDERTFGGYWEPGRKRGGDDVEWGKIRLFGKELPHIMTHNPLTESAQMGSTMMRVALARLKKDSPESKGLTAGAVKALVGLAGKAPVSSPLMRLGEGRANVSGDLVKGLVPQLLQNIAEDTDDTERSPKTAFEQFETAVPGLRQDVPEKVNRR